MSLYNKYQHLLGLQYKAGRDDCYGLVRRFYKDEYGLSLRNYARPLDIFFSGKDLISENFSREGFDIVDTNYRDLQLGDGLLIALGCRVMNHVSVYVGNNMILHHLHNRPSSADDLSEAWKQRTLSVVRHPFITEKNSEHKERIDLLDLLPPHVRHRYKTPPPVETF